MTRHAQTGLDRLHLRDVRRHHALENEMKVRQSEATLHMLMVLYAGLAVMVVAFAITFLGGSA